MTTRTENPSFEERRILTPDQRLRVFISSTLTELATERRRACDAVERLRLIPVMFEAGSRPHPPQALYRAYLGQSHVFVGIYWESYGWVAPDSQVSGIEDEYLLSVGKPTLVYVKTPAPERDQRLDGLLQRIEADGRSCYRPFESAEELSDLLADDLAVLLTEQFEAHRRERASALGALRPRPLPVPPNPIVGRNSEIATLAASLRQEDVRLVTLTGPGGVGKTRLALAVASNVSASFADGVFFVDLAAIPEAADVPPAVASAIGMTYERSRDLGDAVVEVLAPASVLLFLDNFEQVMDAAPFVASILAACPGVKALVTSRAPLHVRGERLAPVEPLALPGEEPSIEEVEASSAVRLLAARAQQAKPGFTITPENAAALAEICTKLDGLPLAIELAAPALRVLPPASLAARISDRVGVLVGDVDTPERQRTLAATIDWSYDMLAEPERRALARLSVFVGGFTLEAAEAVCADVGEPDVLERLASLVDKSLVVAEEDGAGRPRFRLLETVRAHAESKLDDRGETDDARHRHESFFREFCRVAGRGLRNSSQREWYFRMAADQPNVEAATARAMERGDYSIAFELALSASVYNMIACLHADKAPAVEALYAENPPLPDDARAWLLFGVGGLRLEQRDLDLAEAIPPLTEAVAIWHRLGRRLYEADAEAFLGLATAAGLPHLDRAAALYRQLDDTWGLAFVHHALGLSSFKTGDLADATAKFREARRLALTIDSDFLVGTTHCEMGFVALAQDGHDEALETFTEAASLLLGVYNRDGLADCLSGFAAIALRSGDPQEAAVLVGASDATRERIGYFLSVKWSPVIPAISSEVRAALGDEVFRRAYATGSALSIREAVLRAVRRFGARPATVQAGGVGDTQIGDSVPPLVPDRDPGDDIR